jgi:chromosome segregation ATPase
MSDDKPTSPREWWIVETKHSYFIYEDEPTAARECKSQSDAYGYAEVHHAKSDYDQLKAALERCANELLDGSEKEFLLDKRCNELRAENERLHLRENLLRIYLTEAKAALKNLLCEISEPSWTDERMKYEERQITRGAIDEAKAALEKLKRHTGGGDE